MRAVLAPVVLLLGAAAVSCAAQEEVKGSAEKLRAVQEGGAYVGFDVLSRESQGPAGESVVAVVRFSSGRLITARRCQLDPEAKALEFSGLAARAGSGLELGGEDRFRVEAGGRLALSFDLTIRQFDAAAWKSTVGAEPFHFLALYLPDAEAWHQRGWLNATPLADRFPLLGDVHAGTPEVSAYKYNRNWSYTPPLGAHPIPVIGLWAPKVGRYVGLSFAETRLRDNSEKDLATGYRWVEPQAGAKPDAGQFVALVHPYGGRGYQDLVFPQAGDRIRSRARLLWSLHLPATQDPNRLFWADQEGARPYLAHVPAVPDVSWIPGGIRLRDFQGPPQGGLIGGVERPFQVEGAQVPGGWTWHNESPTAVAVRRGDARRIAELEHEAAALLPFAKRFVLDGEECVFWEKPLSGEWTADWGGRPVTTLHNANGFAAGRLFLGLLRDCGKAEYLPVVDGVFNWAKRIAWTRNEFADVPSSPFAIGGTLSASFCLEYWMAFRDAADAAHRQRAREALDLARSFTYRYMIMWLSDSDRDDGLDPTFLWEPNSGRDWTGAACANEVFWNLDTLAQTAVHTGDPVLLWALAGSLSRWHQLYQDAWREKLADYQAADMTEGFGLYAGNVYGVGARAAYGFASPLVMCEPVGDSFLRVLAGEGAAIAFKKSDEAAALSGYSYHHPGDLSFTVRAGRPRFDLSLTVPYVDLSGKPVAVERAGQRLELKPGEGFLRPPQVLWSLYVKDLQSGDRVVVGAGGPAEDDRARHPDAPFHPEGAGAQWLGGTPGFNPMPIVPDTAAARSWDRLDSFAGFPIAARWSFGVPFAPAAEGGRWVATRPLLWKEPLRGATAIHLLYSGGGGPPPAVEYADGSRVDAPDREALAWRAWPPIHTARILAGRFPVDPAKAVAGIDPRGRFLVAATAALPGGDEAAAATSRAGAALAGGAAAWQRMQAEDERLGALGGLVEKLPQGSIALLPPKPAGPAMALAARTGLTRRAVVLSPEALVDPTAFGAQRFPVALYAGGEDYVHTVHSPGDAAAAIVRYVRAGGTLVLLASGPWPFYYATGPGFHRPEPLTERLGLPLFSAIEGAPGESLLVKVHDQKVVKIARKDFPYPEGDRRLRSIDRTRIPAGARYTPIASVQGAGGKDYGDAAGLLELAGGGRILYAAGILLGDPEIASAFLEALVTTGAKK